MFCYNICNGIISYMIKMKTCSADKKIQLNPMPKRCIFPGCTTQPVFNLPGESIATHCATHKLDGMIDIVSKRCIFPECTTHPSYNLPGESTATHCATHKLDGMIDIKSKRCIFPGCMTQPKFNLPGE